MKCCANMIECGRQPVRTSSANQPDIETVMFFLISLIVQIENYSLQLCALARYILSQAVL